MKRKIIDERGRLFGKISIIDILAVLLLIVLAAAVYVRFFAKDETVITAPEEEFSYQIMIKNVRMFSANALCVGDEVYDKNSGALLGTIADVEISDSKREVCLADGTYVMADVENGYDVLVTLNGAGTISDGNYYVSNNYELCVNGKVSFYTKYLESTAVVWSIS